jgi:acetolactate synthase-1/2/3 large subunit
MKVYERLAEAFAGEGTKTIFGIMGDGNMFWMHALDKHGINMIEVRHEGAGLGMADGWARATHDVGVCTATCGPGVSQLATALVTASRASSPLVAFVGEYPTNDQDYVQRYDQSRFAEACESGFVRLASPDAVDDVVRKAFYLAKTESRPILLSCPMDIQQKNFDDDDPYKPSSTLMPSVTVSPNPAAIAQAVDVIANSKMPVVLVGRGAIWSHAEQAVVKLAERTGAIIATTLMAKTWLADQGFHVGISGFYGTRTAMQLFEEADCVIAVGASLNKFTVEGGDL